MFKNKKLTLDFSRKVAAAARMSIDDMNSGRAQHEPAVTDRFIAYLQSEVRKSKRSSFQWSAMTLTDRGPNSQERRYGADFLGSLEINLPSFSVRKGFLAQAKRVEPGQSFSKPELNMLVSQCNDMLQLSAASYVFLYSVIDGFSVVPALAIVAAQRTTSFNPHELTNKPIQKFFSEHFECFIGDRSLSIANINTLDALFEKYQARTAIHIKVGPEDSWPELPFD